MEIDAYGLFHYTLGDEGDVSVMFFLTPSQFHILESEAVAAV